MTCDPNILLQAAKCFQCYSAKELEMVKAYLLCQITSGGGTGGAIQILSTTDADPNAADIKPSDTTKAAIFYQDPSVTGGIYNVWHWNIQNQIWVQYSSP